MKSSKYTGVIFCVLNLVMIQVVNGKTVYLNGNRIESHTKPLNLPPEEVDENVSPIAPNKLEAFNNAQETVDYIIEESTTEILDTFGSDINSASSLATTLATLVPEATTQVPIVENTNNNTSGLIKYCKCIEDQCSCCRSFNLPFVPVKGPACAKMRYLGNNKMSVSLKYGDLTLATQTISSRKSRPLCVGLPGGYSTFCGRFYSVSKANENFKACLGFELRADEEIEASLRVSCFKFGSRGLKVAEPEPFPDIKNKGDDDDDDDDEDDEDEDDDIFDFAGSAGSSVDEDPADDDEDEDDDYELDEDDNQKEEYDDDDDGDDEDDDEKDVEANNVSPTDDDDDEADSSSTNDNDYGGFSLTSLFGGNKKTTKQRKTQKSSNKRRTKSKANAFNANKAQRKDDTSVNIEDCTEFVQNAIKFEKDKIIKKNNSKTPRKKSKKTKVTNEAELGLAYEIFNELLDLFS